MPAALLGGAALCVVKGIERAFDVLEDRIERGAVAERIEGSALRRDERAKGERQSAVLGGDTHAHGRVARAREPVIEPGVAVDEGADGEHEQVEDLALEEPTGGRGGWRGCRPRDRRGRPGARRRRGAGR